MMKKNQNDDNLISTVFNILIGGLIPKSLMLMRLVSNLFNVTYMFLDYVSW